jgi:hypothetical protein
MIPTKRIKAIYFTEQQISEVHEFAKKVRDKTPNRRSDGINIREEKEKIDNIIIGKLGEIAIKNFFSEKGIYSEFDLEIKPNNEYDNGDIIIYDYIFSIKTTSNYSKYLMITINSVDILEKKPDYFILVRIKKDNPKIIKWYAHIDGYILFKEFIGKSIEYKQGDFIPESNTSFDTDNYVLHRKDLNNDWNNLIQKLRKNLSILNFL